MPRGACAAPIEAADVVVVNRLLGNRDRRSRDTAGDPAHRAHQRGRQNRRHRLLRVAGRGRSSGAAGRCRGRAETSRRRSSRRTSWMPSSRPPRCASARGTAPAATRSAPGERGRTAYTLRVQTGCDQACAYCIIPSTRGHGRSVPLPRVLDEVDRAVGAGYRELQLTGVHLGSYGRDLTPPASLIVLLRALVFPPVGFPCPHELARADGLHSRSDRAGDRESAVRAALSSPAAACQRRRSATDAAPVHRGGLPGDGWQHSAKRLPHAAIGTDLVVGFPGETDADAEETLGFIREGPFTYLHVFPYLGSPRYRGVGDAGQGARAAHPRAGARRARGRGTLARRFRAAQVGTVRPG